MEQPTLKELSFMVLKETALDSFGSIFILHRDLSAVLTTEPHLKEWLVIQLDLMTNASKWCEFNGPCMLCPSRKHMDARNT